MMPTYKPGSLVLVDTSVSLSDVDIGDVLVYRGAGEVILHRLVGDNLLKGDANKEAQIFKLTKANFVGKESFTIPELGEIVNHILKNKKFVWILIAALILIAACIPIE